MEAEIYGLLQSTPGKTMSAKELCANLEYNPRQVSSCLRRMREFKNPVIKFALEKRNLRRREWVYWVDKID